jgi:S-formylglutathione hydrolase FrmB
MKILFALTFCWLTQVSPAQQKGTIAVTHIAAASLHNNAGENPVRRVTIYLPPGYATSGKRYPVIYYLHGFAWSDSLLVASDHINQLLDKGISSGKIRPVIVVMPDEYTLYKGSFYTNSSLTGNWADFTGQELVKFIDQHYRTIANKESRGVAGHSMGGHGALKMAMMFPDVFSSVYALSPAILSLDQDFGPTGAGFKRAQQIKTVNELVSGWSEVQANLVVAIGRAYSPNHSKPPFYADLPFTYEHDSLITNNKILAVWNENSPLNMVDRYVENLKKMKAIKLDWGRNDEFTHIPVTCKLFSQKLEALGINHYAEEYIGTHGSKVSSDDGRILNEMLPFFNTYLNYGAKK